MTAYSQASSAYARATRAVGSPRSIELQAFQRVTAKLSAATAPDAPVAARAEALHENIRLWTVLAIDLAQDDNGLSDGLRASLIGLAGFVQKQSLAAMSGQGDLQGDLEALIDINAAIVRGLRGEPGAGLAPAVTAA